MVGPEFRCDSQGTWTDTMNLNGEFENDDATVRFRFLLEHTQPQGSITCATKEESFSTASPLQLPPREWSPYYSMPALVGEKSTFSYSFPGFSSASGATVEFLFEKIED